MTALTPTVFIRKSTVLTNSLDIAAVFGKQHKHVMRDIRNLIESTGTDSGPNLDCYPPGQSGSRAALIAAMFLPTSREVKTANGGTNLYPCYDMTRDGFTLLVMGFTGEKALGFKLRYIEAFNRMEAELHAGIGRGDPRKLAVAQNQAIALAKAVERETNPAIRRMTHAMLETAMRGLGMDAPPLEDLGRDAPPPPDLLGLFWDAVERLEREGAPINHAVAPDLIALNLPQLAKEADERGVTIPAAARMHRALRQSQRPLFVAYKVVHSAVAGASLHCWVFRRA